MSQPPTNPPAMPPVPPYGQPAQAPLPPYGQPAQPPVPPYGQPAPSPLPPYGQPAQPLPGQPTFAAPYAPLRPVGVSPLLPTPQGSRTLGTVALVLSLVATVGATTLSAIAGFLAAMGAMNNALGESPSGLEDFHPDEWLRLLTPVRDLVLWAEIGFWAGTVLGIWALVQGIAAIVRRRGRGAGIAAVVIAALGPFVFSAVVYTVIGVGIAAGATGR